MPRKKEKRSSNKKKRSAVRTKSGVDQPLGQQRMDGNRNPPVQEGDGPLIDMFPYSDRVMGMLEDSNGKYVKDGKVTSELKKDSIEALFNDLKLLAEKGLIELPMSDEEKHAAKKHEEALFKDHSTHGDCDICFVPLPLAADEKTYKVCCGKVICNGCMHMMRKKDGWRGDVCPFCRELTDPSNMLDRVMNRVKLDDPNAMICLMHIYGAGAYGQKKDETKAFEMLVRAAELGSAEAQCNLGNAYEEGLFGAEKDERKSLKYHELAAINGSIEARYFLGLKDYTRSTVWRGKKHCMIGAKAGYKPSLELVKNGFKLGLLSKDEYEESLRAYHDAVNKFKSNHRDKAAALQARGIWPVSPQADTY